MIENVQFFCTVYADMSDDKCNSLDFALGNTGLDATIPTRSFTIKVYCDTFKVLDVRIIYVYNENPYCSIKLLGNAN